MTKQPTSDLKSAVNSYLLARAHAELQREKVDKIQKHLLETASYLKKVLTTCLISKMNLSKLAMISSQLKGNLNTVTIVLP
jgi:hypothetical protein